MMLAPLAIATVAALGALTCHAAGWALHGGELLLAAAISLMSAEAALVPLLLVRGADTAAVAQAGLGGTAAQMLLSCVLLGLVVVLKLSSHAMALVWWSLVFYWVSLIMVVAIVIIAIRSACPAGSRNAPGGDNAAKQ